MITVSRTSERTLDTPEKVGAHVHTAFKRRQAAAPFRLGDRVRITSRSGIPPFVMIGDVGTVLLCDPEYSPQTTLMGVNESGLIVQFPVATENLEKVRK